MNDLNGEGQALNRLVILEANFASFRTYMSYFDNVVSLNIIKELRPIELRTVVKPFINSLRNDALKSDAKMLVICISVSWAVLEWYLSHDFIVGNKNLSSCKSAYYVLYKCCFLLFSQVTYQYTFVI